MKRSVIIFVLAVIMSSKVFSQKKEIDLSLIESWKSLGNYGVSNCGRYVWYEIESHKDQTTLIVTDVSNKNKLEFKNSSSPEFTEDSKYFLFNSPSGVKLLNLKSGKLINKPEVHNFKLIQQKHKKWLAYIKNDSLFISDLIDNNDRFLSRISNFKWLEIGKNLVILKDSTLSYIRFPELKFTDVFTSSGLGQIVGDPRCEKMAFFVTKNKSSEIYEYHFSSKKLKVVASDGILGVEQKNLVSSGPIQYSQDGNVLFFNLKAKSELIPSVSTGKNRVKIWAYNSDFLISSLAYKKRNTFWAAASDKFAGIKELENDSTLIEGSLGSKFVLVKSLINEDELYWKNDKRVTYSLIPFSNAEVPILLPTPHRAAIVRLSPDEKFVTWVDTTKCQYYAYNIATNFICELPLDSIPLQRKNSYLPYSIAGWIQADTAIIAYDDYDIWQIDPTNKRSPVCLTGKAGYKNKTIFRLGVDLSKTKYKQSDELLLVLLQEQSKFNGFSSIRLSRANDPKLFMVGPHRFYFPNTNVSTKLPLKAKNKRVFIIQKQSYDLEPNLVITENFLKFKDVTNFQNRQNYKWFSAKLIRWSDSSGMRYQGILYIPEGLDTTRKYPIIFNYYQERSYEIYEFKRPLVSTTNINIPWYLSRDYLIFIPDIYSKKGKTGEMALKCVSESAQFLLNNFPWIDKYRMGLQGHSFGGYITNYIVTHSSLFAAAQSSAGPSDMISTFTGLGFGEKSLQNLTEVGQNNLGSTPWDSAKVYIYNSPIFSVDRTTTPLLLMHGKYDGAVKFQQSVELFTSLRRAKKKVWLLEYECDHILDNEELSLDFFIKQQEFFDFNLKSKGAPDWIRQERF